MRNYAFFLIRSSVNIACDKLIPCITTRQRSVIQSVSLSGNWLCVFDCGNGSTFFFYLLTMTKALINDSFVAVKFGITEDINYTVCDRRRIANVVYLFLQMLPFR